MNCKRPRFEAKGLLEGRIDRSERGATEAGVVFLAVAVAGLVSYFVGWNSGAQQERAKACATGVEADLPHKHFLILDDPKTPGTDVVVTNTDTNLTFTGPNGPYATTRLSESSVGITYYTFETDANVPNDFAVEKVSFSMPPGERSVHIIGTDTNCE